MELVNTILNFFFSSGFSVTLGIFDNAAMYNVLNFFSMDWLQSDRYAIPALRIANFLIIYYIWRMSSDIVFKRGSTDAEKKNQIIYGRNIGMIVAAFSFFLPSEKLLAQVPWVLAALQVLAPILATWFIWKSLPGHGKWANIAKAFLLILVGILITNIASGNSAIPGVSYSSPNIPETISEVLELAGLSLILLGAFLLIKNGLFGGELKLTPWGPLLPTIAKPNNVLADKYKKEADAYKQENNKLLRALEEANQLSNDKNNNADDLVAKATKIISDEASTQEALKKQIQELKSELETQKANRKKQADKLSETEEMVEDQVVKKEKEINRIKKDVENKRTEEKNLNDEKVLLIGSGQNNAANTINSEEATLSSERQTIEKTVNATVSEVKLLQQTTPVVKQAKAENTEIIALTEGAIKKLEEAEKDPNKAKSLLTNFPQLMQELNQRKIQLNELISRNLPVIKQQTANNIATREQLTNELKTAENALESNEKAVEQVTKELQAKYADFNKRIAKIWRMNERMRKRVFNKLIKHIKIINESNNAKAMDGAVKNLDKNIRLALGRLVKLRTEISTELIQEAPTVWKQKLSQIYELLQQDINQLQARQIDVKTIRELISQAQTDQSKIDQVNSQSHELAQVIALMYKNSSLIKQTMKQKN